MQTTVKTVNSSGIAQIAEFLAKNHKLGGEHFTSSMLRAWAEEAEFQLSEGNPPSIELKARDSLSGATQEFTISEKGIDSHSVEIDE